MDGLMKVLLFNVDDLDAYTNIQTNKQKNRQTDIIYIHTYIHTYR